MVARRTLLVLGFVGVLAGSGWVYAQQRSASRPANLSAQDYVDIQMLYARYNQGSDFSDTAMWMSIWADDALFKPGNQPMTGTKELAEFRASRNAAAAKGGGQRRHQNSSIVLTPTPEGANGRAYFTLLDTSAKQPVIASAGYYDDTFVKSNKGWVIKSRILHFDPPPSAGQRSQ